MRKHIDSFDTTSLGEEDPFKIIGEPNGFIDELAFLAYISKKNREYECELSDGGMKKIREWMGGSIAERERVNWADTYLGMAHTLAKRSHDSQTQCGCIITTHDHKPLGMGYNGFPAGLDDTLLPNTRPEKYPWMIHAELNAILNCSGKPTGGIAYVTGHPCLHCLMCMVQVGISEVIYDMNHPIHMVDNEDANLDILKWLAGNKIKVSGYAYEG